MNYTEAAGAISSRGTPQIPPRLYHLNTHCKQGDSRKKQLTGAERLDALVSKIEENASQTGAERKEVERRLCESLACPLFNPRTSILTGLVFGGQVKGD